LEVFSALNEVASIATFDTSLVAYSGACCIANQVSTAASAWDVASVATDPVAAAAMTAATDSFTLAVKAPKRAASIVAASHVVSNLSFAMAAVVLARSAFIELTAIAADVAATASGPGVRRILTTQSKEQMILM
jgi:hypothetical protein